MKHVPVYTKETIVGETSTVILVYNKDEFDDDFLFRKTRSVSINASALEKCDMVRIYLRHRNATIVAKKSDIKAHKDVKTFHSEVKYYYPVEKWHVVSGDKDWWKKLPCSPQNFR